MPEIMDKTGIIHGLDTAFKMLMEYQVIFLGEQHDCADAHAAELDLLAGLAALDPNIVLALEMFEKDVQPVLNDYLEGKISEPQFLERSRAWPNYQTDYRPLVEFCKTAGIPVIAANIPRRAAAAVAAANAVSPEVLGVDAAYLPATPPRISRPYYRRFKATMARMPRMGPMHHAPPQALFKAQLVKDAVMAAALEPYLERRILFCCGRFHSDYHQGIPFQLQRNHPRLQVAVIAMASSVHGVPMKQRSALADFFWIPDGQ